MSQSVRARRGCGGLACRRGALLTLLVSALACSAAAAQQSERGPASGAPPTALVFEGVTVVDVHDGRLYAQQTVVVVGNHIQAVESKQRARIPAGARVIRAGGTYMIPGLWDMHVHTNQFSNTIYPLFIANGVTGVREMSAMAGKGAGSLDSVLQWRREILAGTRVGPRVINPGPYVGGPAWKIAPADHSLLGTPFWIGVATPEEGRRAVDSLKAAGADFIKVYNGLSRDVFFAIAAEARRVGIPFGGHLSDSVTTVEASDSGQRSIEHWLNCDTSTKVKPLERNKNTVNPQECPVLAARFRRNGTWFSMAHPFLPGIGLVTPLVDPMRYWPDIILRQPYDSLSHEMETNPDTYARRSLEQWAAAYNDGLETALGKMHRAGIRLLAGTDTGPVSTWSSVPGFSLQDVLWRLVRAGLTPLEALQTATLNPAEYFNATDTLGTIAPGKLADFVLLDANPLVDIYNTRRIRAVVANGRFFDRGDLDALLLETERLARSSSRPTAAHP